MQLQLLESGSGRATWHEHQKSGAMSTAELDQLIRSGSPVAVGVSGGSDSQAAALATFDYLDAMGHEGPRVLIHSDLGSVEWNDSLRICEELAAHLNAELIRVKRAAGGLMERWHARWTSSKRRYRELSTVTLVLPWSGPSLRFCTSELKTSIITSELRRRFGGTTIINATGVRWDESPSRAQQAIAESDRNGSTRSTTLWSWRPIAHWNKPRTFDAVKRADLRLHPAYTQYQLSRVSCRFCVLASLRDLVAASATDEAYELLQELVGLEVESTFGFQGGRWLGDVAAARLGSNLLSQVASAKERGRLRQEAERVVPRELLYQKGWPVRMPTKAEAELLADVRLKVAAAVGIVVDRVSPTSVMDRYAELLAAKQLRDSSGKRAIAA